MKTTPLLLLMLALPVLCAGQVELKEAPKIALKGPQRLSRIKAVPVDTIQRPAVSKGHYTYAVVIDGDTIPLYQMREVQVYASGMLLTPKEIRQNQKLIRNVRLMLPYAQEGRRRLDALELQIAALPKKDRKKAIKDAETQLLNDYKGEISNYTFSQGLVLIKLIDRETNRSAYRIVGELRGSLRAGLYQTLAKLFGYNLKETFDPKHDKKDDLIDRICISIERGQI
ncbi:MAG: DUF4294 domain-containing protein [Bacteroidales bacterium]|nr:DUF4294 domain-containing protein [Bacteroidales bacterium]